MSYYRPAPNHNFVPEYQQSSIPWMTASAVPENGSPHIWNFPYVSRFVVVSNFTTDTIRIGVTENGIIAGNNKYFLLPPSSSTGRLEIKTTKLAISGGGSGQYSILAGLTSVPHSQFPVLTGSDGVAGVG